MKNKEEDIQELILHVVIVVWKDKQLHAFYAGDGIKRSASYNKRIINIPFPVFCQANANVFVTAQ